MEKFIKGTRVKYNEMAIRRHISYKDPNRLGTVVNRSSKQPDCIRVHWDGTKSTSTVSIHEDFLEIVR